jgi:hypothetical protein
MWLGRSRRGTTAMEFGLMLANRKIISLPTHIMFMKEFGLAKNFNENDSHIRNSLLLDQPRVSGTN